jgi:hypothetical protein
LSCRTLASFLSLGHCFLSFFPRFAPFNHLIFHSTVWSCSHQRRFDDFSFLFTHLPDFFNLLLMNFYFSR